MHCINDCVRRALESVAVWRLRSYRDIIRPIIIIINDNRADIRLVEDKIQAKKLTAKRNFDHCTIFDENLVAVHMKRTKLYYNKAIYVYGMSIDLSKTLMYDCHYNYIKPKYGDKVKLLMYEIEI